MRGKHLKYKLSINERTFKDKNVKTVKPHACREFHVYNCFPLHSEYPHHHTTTIASYKRL